MARLTKDTLTSSGSKSSQICTEFVATCGFGILQKRLFGKTIRRGIYTVSAPREKNRMMINGQLNKDKSTTFPKRTLVGETATLWEC